MRPWWYDSDSTSPEALVAAAWARGVPAEHLPRDVSGPVPVPLLRLEAHGGAWTVYPDQRIGWCAVQVDGVGPDAEPIADTDVVLGASDCPAVQVVANLLDSAELPAGLNGPAIPTRHQAALESQ